MLEFPLRVSRANMFHARVRVLYGRDDFFSLFAYWNNNKKTAWQRSLLFFFVKNKVVIRCPKMFRVTRSRKFIVIYTYVYRIPILLWNTLYIASTRIHVHIGFGDGRLVVCVFISFRSVRRLYHRTLYDKKELYLFLD
jgi:hypothetical protein